MQYSEPDTADTDNNNTNANTTLQTLDGRIRVILQSTPLHQLGTITTRDVRARLLQDGAIDEAWVKKNKKALHALIAGVFEQVSAPLVVPVSDNRSSQNGYENGVGLGRAEEEEGGEEYAASAYNGGVNGSEYGYSETYSEREGTESQYADENGTNEADGDGASSSSRPFPPAAQQHNFDSKQLKQTEPKKQNQKQRQKPKPKRALTDEEYARRLSSELNGRPRSSRLGKTITPRSKSKSKASRSRASASVPKRNKKSAERVLDSGSDEEGREYEYEGEDEDVGAAVEVEAEYDSEGQRIRSSRSRRDRDSKPPPKKKRKSRGDDEDAAAARGSKGGFKKEYILSVPLSTLLSTTRLSRPQVVKQLWDYIKSNNLQNPHNRREILCDDLLRPVFNADKIDMFRMNKVLGGHLHEIETE